MGALKHYVREHRNELVKEMLAEQVAPAERAAKQLERLITVELQKTLRFASQFGTVGFRDASIQTQSAVNITDGGVEIEVNALTVDTGGQPHFVWHLISFGRPRFVQRKTSPPIRKRSELRTSPDTLTVSGFPGYSGETFVVPAGAIVAAIPARHWYETAAKKLAEEIAKYPTLKALNLEVVVTKVERP
jgi:hypothetical protein